MLKKMKLNSSTRPSRTNTQKRLSHQGSPIIGHLNAEVGSQEIPGVTGKFGKFGQSRSKANRVLPRECTGRSKHPLPKIQEKTLYMDITRWSTPKSD